MKSKDVINETPAGLAVDVNGKPIMDTSAGKPDAFWAAVRVNGQTRKLDMPIQRCRRKPLPLWR
jgi:hypothetical protein